MNDRWFGFRIGEFRCFAVSDGTFTYAPPQFPPPLSFLFPTAPKDRLEQKLREQNIRAGQLVAWTSPYTCMLIDTGKHRVLIDTGAGRLGPDTGKLPENLRAAGFTPHGIDTVVLTHGHPDHIGGITDEEGRIVFSEARFVMGEDEWNFWNGEPTKLHGDEKVNKVLRQVAQSNLLPIHDRLDRIDRGKDILPGIDAIPAPGHTPGHMAISLTSGGEHLLCLGDAMLHPIQVEEPDWHAMIDFSPEKTVASRYQLLEFARNQKALVFGFHFPFPGLGRIVGTSERWIWQPW